MIERTPPARVATVAGRPVPVSRLEERLEALRRGPRGRHLPPAGTTGSSAAERWVAHELVTEEVLRHEAREAGIDDSPLGAGEDSDAAPIHPSTVARLAERVTSSVAVSEGDMRDFYARNGDLYRRPGSRRVRHVLLPDEPSALQAARHLAGDPAGPDGELREVRRGELSGPLEDAIFDAEPGDVIGPIHTAHGWHVMRLEAVAEESVAPYDEVRPAIEGELLAAARERAFGEWLDRRRRAVAVIEPEFEHPGHPVHGAPSHRH